MADIVLDDDTMKYYLLNGIIHDYLHDVSPYTTLGKKRIEDSIISLRASSTSGTPLFPVSTGGGGKVDDSRSSDSFTQSRGDSSSSRNLYDEFGDSSMEQEEQQEDLINDIIQTVIIGVYGYIQLDVISYNLSNNNIYQEISDDITIAFDHYKTDLYALFISEPSADIIYEYAIVKELERYIDACPINNRLGEFASDTAVETLRNFIVNDLSDLNISQITKENLDIKTSSSTPTSRSVFNRIGGQIQKGGEDESLDFCEVLSKLIDETSELGERMYNEIDTIYTAETQMTIYFGDLPFFQDASLPYQEKIRAILSSVKMPTVADFSSTRRVPRIQDYAKRILNQTLSIYFEKNCKKAIRQKKNDEVITLKALADEARQKKILEKALERSGEGIDENDMQSMWKVGVIYAKTGLLSLGLCNENGEFVNELYTDKAYDDSARKLLKMEAQIIRTVWGSHSFPIYNVGKGNIDDQLERCVYDIFKGNPYILSNESSIKVNQEKLSSFRSSIGTKPAFIDNALNADYPHFFNSWPKTLCNIPTFLDGWGASGCSTSSKDGITSNGSTASEVGSFSYTIHNNNITEFYNAQFNYIPTDGSVAIGLQTTMPVNGTMYTINMTTNITNKKLMSAGYVLKLQITYITQVLMRYIDLINSQGISDAKNLDLWEWFRTDSTENPMLRFMQLGGAKSLADVNIELSALMPQVDYYNNSEPLSYNMGNNPPILTNDRPLLQGGTDRPSGIGRAVVLSLLAENSINQKAMVGYSSSSKKFLYTLPPYLRESNKKRPRDEEESLTRKKGGFHSRKRRLSRRMRATIRHKRTVKRQTLRKRVNKRKKNTRRR